MGIGYDMMEANFRFETPFFEEKGGFHLIKNPLDERVTLWEKALADAGVEVLYNTTATGLIMDGDKAVGVTARKADGTKVTVNAKAVIIASGGYLGNRDLQEKFLKTRKLNAAAGGNSLCTGDGILMANDAGAVLNKTFGYCPCEYGGTNAKASRPAKRPLRQPAGGRRGQALHQRGPAVRLPDELRLRADHTQRPLVRHRGPGLCGRHEHPGPV